MTTALVTGATAGIGKEFAIQLAARGHDLVLVARDVERLEELAAELRGQRGVQVEILPADLSDAAATRRVADRLADENAPVEILVNNAGFGMKKSFLVNDLEAEEGMLDVLVRAVLVLSHAAGRAMKARGHGQIIERAVITPAFHLAALQFADDFELALEHLGRAFGHVEIFVALLDLDVGQLRWCATAWPMSRRAR